MICEPYEIAWIAEMSLGKESPAQGALYPNFVFSNKEHVVANHIQKYTVSGIFSNVEVKPVQHQVDWKSVKLNLSILSSTFTFANLIPVVKWDMLNLILPNLFYGRIEY